MDRISTASAYGSVLSNLMAAELAQTNAGNQLSTTEKATDLKGYGAGAETLTVMQATSTQVAGYLNDTTTVGAKLATQDNALNEVASSAGSAIQAVTSALAAGGGSGLMQALQTAFGNAVDGLNTTYNGEYLFAGGQVTTQPVSATTIAQLASGPPMTSFFHNDQMQTTSQINQNTSIQSGFLADSVGTPLFGAFQAIQQYVNTNGAFSTPLTTAQSDFLTQQLTTLNTVQSNLNDVVAQNGQLQDQVTNTQASLTTQQTMLQGLIGSTTGADLAQASANLQEAGLSIQAAGQVFQALNATSLLNTLTST